MESEDPKGETPQSEDVGKESPEPRDSGPAPAVGKDSGPVASKPAEPAQPAPVERKPAESKPRTTRIPPSNMGQREFSRMTRRELLKVVPVIALGAVAIPGVQTFALKKGLAFSDWASSVMFRRGHLAPTYADSELTPFDRFPINDYDVDDPGVIFENWTLTVTGLVQKPGDYRLGQIQALPLQRQNTQHVCVEGWNVIGRFGGTRLSNFLNLIGADTTARFVTVQCADDYYESLDMETALHPQTLLCWEMYDRPITREHGAPVRLNIPTKIGYKQAKYLTDLKVTNVLDGKVGYWEDQGYSEFYGL